MKVGPINAFNGFPFWYKDGNGLRLQLNFDHLDPFSGIDLAELPNPSQPVSFPNNYPAEAFYHQVEAEMTTGTGERARLVLALEAAFVNEVPTVDEQIVFGRVRIRIFGLQPNAEYTVTHPYGVDTFIAESDDGIGEINFTEDIGGFNGGSFELALNSRVFPFLQWDPNIAPLAPEGYIGDPNVPHEIVGSLFVDQFGQPQNFFRIEGPRIGIGSPDRSTTPGLTPDNCIETRNFTVVGEISTVSGVDVLRATYTQTESTNGLIDVFAASDDNAQIIEVTGNGINPTQLQSSNGNYFARVRYSGETPPTTITVTNLSDNPNSIKEVVPVDFITASANFDTDSQNLSITASSSDSVRTPILSVSDFGMGELTIPSEGTLNTNLTFTPPHVIITSSAGGERTIPVSVTGLPDGPIPVTAHAGEDQTVLFGSPVTLNGLNSTGVITTFSWTQLSGTEITIEGADTATPSFTAPSSETTLLFELTVDGEGGASKDTVAVNIIEFASIPIANAGPNQSVQQGEVVTLSGSATGTVTHYQWEQISGPIVQLTNANTATTTFQFPNQTVPLSFRLTVNGPGGTSFDDIQVTTVPIILSITRAEFRSRDAEWRISGNSDVIGIGATISIFIGNSLSGLLLSQVAVDALGEWAYRIEGSSVLPDETRAVSIQSSSSATLLNVPLDIRR